MKKTPLEKDYYPPVALWMEKRFQCFKVSINKGISYGRIDVLGISDIGGDLTSDVETIAVEVKRGETPFTNACGQAIGYKVYANRVYLADLRDEKSFGRDELSIASHLGIGLLRIRRGKCHEILSSPVHQPIPKLQLRLFDALKLGKCQLCDSLFDLGENWCDVNNSSLSNAVVANMAFVYPLNEVEKRKMKHALVKSKNEIANRRYLCKDCIAAIIAPIEGRTTSKRLSNV